MTKEKRKKSVFSYGKSNPIPRSVSYITDIRELTVVAKYLAF
jgi:hypothetical protein